MFDMRTNFFYRSEAPIFSFNYFLSNLRKKKEKKKKKKVSMLSGIGDENQHQNHSL